MHQIIIHSVYLLVFLNLHSLKPLTRESSCEHDDGVQSCVFTYQMSMDLHDPVTFISKIIFENRKTYI